MSEPPARIIHSRKLRPFWVCHFLFWDGPIDGLVEIDGEYFYAKHNGRMNRSYHLWPIDLTDECQRWLEDCRASYHHAFYADGVRPTYDGRPLAWFHEKWAVNPIVAMVKGRTS
jgi:hypothetical protein